MSKKKIKDLTIKERVSICAEHSHCDDCPLSITFDCGQHIHCAGEIIEREVEVDDMITTTVMMIYRSRRLVCQRQH